MTSATRFVVAAGLAFPAAIAAAQPSFFFVTNDSSQFDEIGDDRIEARFRADTTNWNLRLAPDSFPDTSDVLRNAGNGRGAYEFQTFAFTLSYDASLEQMRWETVGGVTGTDVLEFDTAGMGPFNTFQIFTAGSRGGVDIEGMAFDWLGTPGVEFNAFPSIDTSPSTDTSLPTFAETFLLLGNSFDLLSGDWTLSGSLTFGAFTRDNPSEASKLTIKLRNTESPFVPTPGTAALLAAGGLAAARRRR